MDYENEIMFLVNMIIIQMQKSHLKRSCLPMQQRQLCTRSGREVIAVQTATLNKDRMEIKNFHTQWAQFFTLGEKAPYPFLPAVIIDENRMANHDVTKSGDSDRNQTVPVNEQVVDEDVRQTRYRGAHHAQGRLGERDAKSELCYFSPNLLI